MFLFEVVFGFIVSLMVGLALAAAILLSPAVVVIAAVLVLVNGLAGRFKTAQRPWKPAANGSKDLRLEPRRAYSARDFVQARRGDAFEERPGRSAIDRIDVHPAGPDVDERGNPPGYSGIAGVIDPARPVRNEHRLDRDVA